jgi:hypothetical protein
MTLNLYVLPAYIMTRYYLSFRGGCRRDWPDDRRCLLRYRFGSLQLAFRNSLNELEGLGSSGVL